MSEKEDKLDFKIFPDLFANSKLPPWVTVIMRILILLSIFSVLASLIFFFLNKTSEWIAISLILLLVNLGVYLFVFVMLFLSASFWYIISFLGVTNALQNFEENQERNSIAKGKCVMPSTWITFSMLSILCILILLLLIFAPEYRPEIGAGNVFFAISVVYLFLLSPPIKKFVKYIDDITEHDGEIYYQGRLMSKWEKTFFKLARTAFIYIHIFFCDGIKEITASDGVTLFKGRVISNNEMKFFEWMGWIKIIFWVVFIYCLLTKKI